MTNHLARAWQLYELRRDKLAVEETKRHLAEWPDDADAYRLIAHAAARLKDAETALEAAKEAVSLAPDDGHTHYALAVAEKVEGRWPQAEQAIREAIRLAPQEARFFGCLASILIGKRQFKEARPVVLKGLAIDPSERYLVFAQPFLLWALGQNIDAGLYLQKALCEHPEDSNLHALRGVMLKHEGFVEQAVPHLLESLRIDPENSFALNQLHEAKTQPARSRSTWADNKRVPPLLVYAAVGLVVILLRCAGNAPSESLRLPQRPADPEEARRMQEVLEFIAKHKPKKFELPQNDVTTGEVKDD